LNPLVMEMNPLPALPPGFRVVEFSGPLLVGELLHWALFGTLSVQLYLYYSAFPNDRLSTKCLVYGVYALEVVETILITHDSFAAFGYGFGDISALFKAFYAYRVHVLSKSYLVPGLIVLVSLTSSIGGFITGAFSQEAGNLALLNTRKISVAAGVWCGASALGDIIIAVCMTYYLSKQDTGFRQTRVLVSKVIRLTIETGSLTALVAVTAVVLFIAFPGRGYFTTATTVVPKLYANSILVVLNARIEILGGRATYTTSMDAISTPSYLRNTPTDGATTNGAGSARFITISREVRSDGDVEMKAMAV